MPTSTIWRRRAAGDTYRGVSPERPAPTDIESLSPERDVAPTFSAVRPPYATEQTSDPAHLDGLGLSHATLPKYEHPYQELEINSHGVARVQTRNLENAEQPDYHQLSPQTYARHQPSQTHAARSNKTRTHTRSGSTIDDLASAAIAHSPTVNGSPRPFAHNGSPSSYLPPRPSTSHISPTGFRDIHEPPAKRIKSDRLPAMEWAPQPSRPSTSYESSQSEAVHLLLALREEVNFSKQITPDIKFAQLHRPTQSPRPYSSHSGAERYGHSEQLHSSDAMDIEPDGQNLPSYTDARHFETTGNDAQNGAAAETTQLHEYHAHGADHGQQPPEPIPSALPVKKPRRLKPEMLMAEVCAECGKTEQRVADGDEATIEWIQCNGCSKWFHTLCAGIRSKAEARTVDKFICKSCEPEHGSTTYVRTSSRARTAIDYAGLNQGLIKSSVETSLHHYIQPLKTGKYAIKTDDFARIRPELLTMEFMQNLDGMKRPLVVPAAWNPRFGAAREAELPEQGQFSEVTVIAADGKPLGADTEPVDALENEVVIDCDQDLLDMIMPRDLTVRKVANIVGPEYNLGVIEVKSQETKGKWTVGQWADYYENSIDQPIRNVISLEVSESPLGRILRRPKVVRDLDLEDQVWPLERYPDKKKKSVQFYCLMSVADSYTDFHIDFGGSSVYYHILKGTKVFFFIPPEDKYLKKYEQWCNSSTQNDTWLPDLCDGNVTRVDLKEGDTAFIPAGWIHSVWTPEDSLVIGGNFLTPIDYELQIRVATIEKDTGVGASFRYPFFQKVMWYTLINYLREDPVPADVFEDFQSDPNYEYLRANPIWTEVGDMRVDAEPDTAEYNFRHYPKSEIRGLPSLRDYLYRTARVASDLPVENINKKAIEAVKRSVPKEHGDPLELIKNFAVWCAWKTGNERAPIWLHTDDLELPEADKKPKKAKPDRIPGERTSSRRAAQMQTQEHPQQDETQSREPSFPSVVTPYKPGESAPGVSSEISKKYKPVSTKPTPLRMACEACRKRRVKCRHRTDPASSETQGGQSRSPSPIDPILGSEGPLMPLGDATAFQVDEGSWANANLAQSALAAADGYGMEQPSANANGLTPPSGKKSRSKACDECRKSKVSHLHVRKISY